MKGDLRDVDYESSEDMDEEEEVQKDMLVTLDVDRKRWGFWNTAGIDILIFHTLWHNAVIF